MRSLGWVAGQRSVGKLHAVMASLLLSIGAHAGDIPSGARITYFEPFVDTSSAPSSGSQKTSRTRELKFNAYGRSFDLKLESNDKLRSAANNSSVVLYRGALTGVSGSWARVAMRGTEVHALIHDGRDLYVIEPSADVADALVAPTDANKSTNILFKLADTIVDAAAATCATDAVANTKGSDTFEVLTREFSAMKQGIVMMQAGGAGLRIQLSAIADAKFRAQFASDAEARDQVLIRMNNVDGIFESQLGIEVQVPTTLVYDAATDPLPTTTSASALLTALADLRDRTPELHTRGLTHLFTGRDLDGATVGLGYVGSVCRKQYGAALSEVRGRGAWLESLITAHEIGHNFGAVHDGETQCSATPQNQFLMSPTVYPNASSFSDCSRELVAKTVASASCVTSIPAADLSLAADLGSVRSGPNREFEWQLSVSNVGGRASQQAQLEVAIPASLKIIEAFVPGGSCTSGAGAISCSLGDVAGGTSAALHLKLSGEALGSNEVSAEISSLADADPMNNRASGSIVIASENEPTSIVQAPSPVTPQVTNSSTSVAESNGGGGGGSFGFFLLSALTGFGLARIRRTR